MRSGPTASPTERHLRRRAGGSAGSAAAAQAGSGHDAHPGFTTEEDTGISDDPRDDPGDAPSAASAGSEGGERLLSRVKMKKMTIRAFFGTVMMVTFAGVIYLGHVYVCFLVFILQCFIFSELVGVRKKQAAERRLPLFRSIQWAWFFIAAFFTWSQNVCEFLGTARPQQVGQSSWDLIVRFVLRENMMISFSLYTVLLMVSVLSLRKGLYKYQITQYTWTIVTICIVVFQTQAVFHIIYAGLFWFVMASSLVICNDIMAYYCGQLFGRKLIRRRFLELSPNKTWEGFLGSAICTLIFAFWFSRKLSAYKWMTCVPDQITFDVVPLNCTPARMYQLTPLRDTLLEVAPLSVRELLAVAAEFAPRLFRRLGEVQVMGAQVHALCLGLFASFAAPFGGFLSSAIKRAYGIKDFNNLIPGHGGMMDRFDCQFVMFLCTFVHHRTFCHSPISVESLMNSAAQLSAADQQEFIRRMQERLLAFGPL